MWPNHSRSQIRIWIIPIKDLFSSAVCSTSSVVLSSIQLTIFILHHIHTLKLPIFRSLPHMHRLRGHAPNNWEASMHLSLFITFYPLQYFGLPTQYFWQVYASGLPSLWSPHCLWVWILKGSYINFLDWFDFCWLMVHASDPYNTTLHIIDLIIHFFRFLFSFPLVNSLLFMLSATPS